MEGIPKLNGGVPERRQSPQIIESQKEYLEQEDDGVTGTGKFNPPTPIDFIGLPIGSKDADFVEWTSRALNLDRSIIEGNGPESDTEYIRINKALDEGRKFLKNMLGYEDRQIPDKDPKEIKSKKDLFELLKNTIPKSKNKEGLSYRPFMYCRLVRASIGAYETLRSEADKLKKETEAFENSMFLHDGEAPLHFIIEDGREKIFALRNDGGVRGRISSRGKEAIKATLRFIVRPESDAATALKDGIASRVKVESFGDAEKTLVALYKWLILARKVSVLKIENQQFFSNQNWKSVQAMLTKLNSEIEKNGRKSYKNNNRRALDRPAIDVRKINFTQGKANETSGGGYEALKIEGTMPLSNSNGESYDRQFEIQIVLADNKNEKGRMHHAVYEVARKVVARTRLDGGCPERVFKQFIREASKDSNIPEDEIKNYLLGGEDAAVVKLGTQKNKRGEGSFISLSVYERWRDFGWVDQDFMEKLEHAARKK